MLNAVKSMFADVSSVSPSSEQRNCTIHKGVTLFLSYTNINKTNSLHHVKNVPKLAPFPQFESRSKCFKVRAISDL